MKHSTLEDTTRRLGETVLIALVVLVATGWVATKGLKYKWMRQVRQIHVYCQTGSPFGA